MTSKAAISEARSAFRKKFPTEYRRLVRRLCVLSQVFAFIAPVPPPTQVRRCLREVDDPDDAHIVARAKATKAHILLTYNTRHFRRVRKFLVMRPEEFLRFARTWLLEGTKREQ